MNEDNSESNSSIAGMINPVSQEENVGYRFRTGYLKRDHSLLQIVQSSLQEILSAYIEPIIKQWIKNFHLLAQIVLGLLEKFKGTKTLEVPRKVSGVELSPSVRETLSKGEETGLMHGFLSKSGKPFKAFLKLDEQGKIQFRFPGPSAHQAPVPIFMDPQSHNLVHNKDLIPAHILGVELNEEVRECLKKGLETPLVEGLRSRKGNTFNAYLRMNLNGDIKFRYPSLSDIKGTELDTNQSQARTSAQKMVPPTNPKNHTPTPIQEPENSATITPAESYPEKIRREGKSKGLPIPDSPENIIPIPIMENPPISISPTETAKNMDSTLNMVSTSKAPSHPESMENSSTTHSSNGVEKLENPKREKSPIPTHFLGKKLDNESLLALRDGKETALILGFTSPAGKVFDAYLTQLGPNQVQVRIPSREKDLKITLIPKIILGVALTEQNKLALKNGKETDLISNFRFPNGKPFDAYLKRNEKGSLIIRTPPVKKQISIPQSL